MCYFIFACFAFGNVKNSSDIRSKLTKEFPLAAYRNTRTTPGGSIVIEADDIETANKIKEGWRKTWFGGNAGVVEARDNPPAGVVKHVLPQGKTDEEIVTEIENRYPNCEVDLFKTNNKFNGMLKITFQEDKDLDSLIKDRITIFQQKLLVDRYNYKPRVIICHRCQKFGHLERLCRSEHPVCGKCGSKEHESEDCEINAEDYKCAHCGGNHKTGDKKCIVVKEKLQNIIDRKNGFN